MKRKKTKVLFGKASAFKSWEEDIVADCMSVLQLLHQIACLRVTNTMWHMM